MAVVQISDTTWTSSTVNSQTLYTSATSQAVTSTNSLVSGNITSNLSGKKVLISHTIATGYADVAATLTLEGSFDGTNWGTLVTLDSDTQPNVAATEVYVADLTDYTSIPYFRIHFNAGAANLGSTSATSTFKYAYTA